MNRPVSLTLVPALVIALAGTACASAPPAPVAKPKPATAASAPAKADSSKMMAVLSNMLHHAPGTRTPAGVILK